MRSALFVFVGVWLVALPGLVSAQEPTRRIRSPRDTLPREVVVDPRFPEDSLLVAPSDTIPEIDIEARRQALESEGFPARDDIFRQLKDLPGFMVFEYRGQEVRLDVE
ncbi:MAG: hypothetical protein M8866_08725, partial [marine benthic group bacterium]|nr:hypothetical protein [Candidatus Benthicola marisminoris]